MFGARRKHTIRFIHPFSNEVIDKYAYISLVPTENKFVAADNFPVSIDAGNQSLPCRLLVACGAIDLTREKQIFHEFSFKRVRELSGVEKIVFDGITRPINMHIFQGGDMSESLNLYLPRH